MTCDSRLFPVLVPPNIAERAVIGDITRGQQMTLVCAVPWSLLARHERRARKTYGVGLEELAARGGLDASEAYAVIAGPRLEWVDANARLATMLARTLELTAA
jgi:predicted nucleic acid-binding protein